MGKRKIALYHAFHTSLPIMAGYGFLGLTYGIYMHELGFNFLYPMVLALTVTPKYILYLGKVLPASVFALLVVYCLRHIHSFSADSLAQVAAVAFTILIHVWKRNMMWSIAAGTLCYMLLIRILHF